MPALKCWFRAIRRCLASAICAGCLIAQTIEIPRIWLNASPKEVLADMDFHRLSVRDRKRIMNEIDPSFGKFSDDRKNRLLREAERANLPRARTPGVVREWSPKDPHCKLEIQGALVVKTLSASELSLTASLERNWGFLDARVAVRNEAPEALVVVPETFIATVVRPRKTTLLFEFPRTVSEELLWASLNYSPPARVSTATLESQSNTSSTADPLSEVSQRSTGRVTFRDPLPPASSTDILMLKYAAETAGRIQAEALRAGNIPAGGAVEGHVWFALDRLASQGWVGQKVKAEEVVLTIFIQNTAYKFPFVLSAR